MDRDELLKQITEIPGSTADHNAKVQRIAEVMQLSCNYRWVGIYDVDEREISIIAWSGMGPPTHPRFPVTHGLSGEAVRSRRSVISNDVANDARYLTAFGSTQSEIIVPIILDGQGRVVATIDVESDQKEAFADYDRISLEKCAEALAQL